MKQDQKKKLNSERTIASLKKSGDDLGFSRL